MKLESAQIAAADDLLKYLHGKVEHFEKMGDPLRDRYIGFYVLTAATHVETVVKEQLTDFCANQNKYLHSIMKADLERLNAKIGYQSLKMQLKRFNPTKADRFVSMLCRLNLSHLRIGNPDLFKSYENLLTNRHRFVHNMGTTFPDVSAQELEHGSRAAKFFISAFVRALLRE
jgi:hypothetical protein